MKLRSPVIGLSGYDGIWKLPVLTALVSARVASAAIPVPASQEVAYAEIHS